MLPAEIGLSAVCIAKHALTIPLGPILFHDPKGAVAHHRIARQHYAAARASPVA